MHGADLSKAIDDSDKERIDAPREDEYAGPHGDTDSRVPINLGNTLQLISDKFGRYFTPSTAFFRLIFSNWAHQVNFI